MDKGNLLPLREDRVEFDKLIRMLFKMIGFDARCLDGSNICPSQKELVLSKDVDEIFEGVPDTVRIEEMKHLVMLGYTSDGQAMFVVCSINQNRLHIRVKGDLFDKLRRACGEICSAIWTYTSKQEWWRELYRGWMTVKLYTDDAIEVMEPMHGHPTITGHIIRHPGRALVRQHTGETILAIMTGLLSLILFLFAPDWAQPLAKKLETIRNFDVAYIQGVLEKAFSALLVTCAVTVIDLAVKYFALWLGRPILWNSGIEPYQASKSSKSLR